MTRRVFGISVLIFSSMLASSFTAAAAEKGGKKNRNANKQDRERAVMGDAIVFALAHDDELKITHDQKAFLQKLKVSLDAERAKDKDEIKINELRDEMKLARKAGKVDEADAFRSRMRDLMEKQAEKWEERTNTELAKILPKEMQAKLKELRGDPDKVPENPFN